MLDSKLDAVRCLLEAKCRHFDFEPLELAKVNKDDQYVTAFLEDNNGNAEKTATAILKALTYRKKYKVYDIKATDLPMEMFSWNTRVGRDIYGRKLMWSNVGCYRNLPELVDISVMVDFKDYSGHFESHEKCDTYLDLRCISVKSIDTRLNRKLTNMVITCFPSTFDHTFIVGLPVGLTMIIKAMVKLLPDRYLDKVSFVTVEEAKARVRSLKPVSQREGSNIRQVLSKQNVPEARIDKLVETFTSAKRMSDKLFDQLGI
ncbi:hypothetical protein HDE_05722 [Halotydeus destructor]|nr:hypothetical protein HDE_05722 [Halotydeus destructor]